MNALGNVLAVLALAGVPIFACAAAGSEALDGGLADTGGTPPPEDAPDQPREHRRLLKKLPNFLKPWRRLMWCIGTLAAEYRSRMYEVLELYERPYRGR